MSWSPTISLHTLVLCSLFSFALCGPIQSNYVEDPEEMSNGTTYTISALTPKMFVKTDQFMLNYTSCAHFSYKLTEKRVKLRAYTCLHSEGGFCTLDKFAFPKDRWGCAKLRPWHYEEKPFSFYFVLEKRPRRYGPLKQHLARKVKRSGSISAHPFGQLTLLGIVPCDQACKDY